MEKRFLLSIVILLLFLFPQQMGATENTPYPFSQEARLKSDIIHGIELLYNWEFDQAEDLFISVLGDRPEDPLGYFYLAMVTWSRMAVGFWSPEVVREYGDRIDTAVTVARKRIKGGEADSYTFFYLGAALGFKGRFRLMQHKYFSSYLIAREAIDTLKISLSMDPDNLDVLFGLGMYDYYTARLSGVLKFLSYLFLHKGDKKEGLRKLHITADRATYSSIEAKSLLLYIYLFLESDFNKALPIARELAERFQKGPTYRYLLGITYLQLDMVHEYRKVVELFRRRGVEERSLMRANLWENRMFYLEASYWLFHGEYVNARSRLETILSNAEPENDPYMIAWPLLKMGMSYDLEDKREKALEIYNRVMKMENGAGAQFLAEKYIYEPVKKGAPFICY